MITYLTRKKLRKESLTLGHISTDRVYHGEKSSAVGEAHKSGMGT